ncbi:MAG: hypothetical protein QXG05_02060 [Nitrososphaerota archaeon]
MRDKYLYHHSRHDAAGPGWTDAEEQPLLIKRRISKFVPVKQEAYDFSRR